MVRLDCLDMTIAVDWDIKLQTKKTNIHSYYVQYLLTKHTLRMLKETLSEKFLLSTQNICFDGKLLIYSGIYNLQFCIPPTPFSAPIHGKK